MKPHRKTESLEDAGNRLICDAVDRRCEERWPASGEVVLHTSPPCARRFVARLLDHSNAGFRAAHNMALLTGEEVYFHHAHGSGLARVVWSRVEGTSVQNGFLIIGNWPL